MLSTSTGVCRQDVVLMSCQSCQEKMDHRVSGQEEKMHPYDNTSTQHLHDRIRKRRTCSLKGTYARHVHTQEYTQENKYARVGPLGWA